MRTRKPTSPPILLAAWDAYFADVIGGAADPDTEARHMLSFMSGCCIIIELIEQAAMDKADGDNRANRMFARLARETRGFRQAINTKVQEKTSQAETRQ